MIVKLLTEHHSEFLSLKGDCTGPSESTHVKMSHCWKSHAQGHIMLCFSFVQEQFFYDMKGGGEKRKGGGQDKQNKRQKGERRRFF